MKLELYRHLWGVEADWADVVPQIKALGYTGIETGLRGRGDELKPLLEANDLKFLPQTFTTGDADSADVRGHLDELKRQIDEAMPLNPVKFNCHSGWDRWSLKEAVAFYEAAVELERDVGIPIAHETHRKRFFFSPFNLRDLIAEVPDVRLCADLSHWVCVCERLIDDLQPILDQVAARTIHIHARVGFNEGPQVPDPRAERYAPFVEAHERWWDQIWRAQADAGRAVSTLTPEFGPPLYQHIDPNTGEPLANLWDVCQWQADRQAARFGARFG